MLGIAGLPVRTPGGTWTGSTMCSGMPRSTCRRRSDPGRCASIFRDQNRRCIGESQSNRPHKMTPRPAHQPAQPRAVAQQQQDVRERVRLQERCQPTTMHVVSSATCLAMATPRRISEMALGRGGVKRRWVKWCCEKALGEKASGDGHPGTFPAQTADKSRGQIGEEEAAYRGGSTACASPAAASPG
eukprot:COSAG01_NODE_2710_length_7221_cov_20.205366_3_plen_187_part_00